MGKTFLAEQVELRRTVVIKTLREQWAQRPGAKDRFRREAELAAAISHPNIIQIFDFAVDDEAGPYLVMEYVEGIPLSLWIHQGFATPELVQIIRSVLLGLDALHRAGIVHRDIKPENILLQNNSSGPPTPKLIDFGLARIIDGEGIARLTRTGQILGTPGYLAPEQVTGMAVDARTDLYSVGVLFYHALATCFPYQGNDPAALIQAVISQDHQPLEQHRPDLPPEFVKLVHRAMNKFPSNRFSSAVEMRAALEPWESALQANRTRPIPSSESVTYRADFPSRPAPQRHTSAKPLSSIGRWGVLALLGIAAGGAAGLLVYSQLDISADGYDDPNRLDALGPPPVPFDAYLTPDEPGDEVQSPPDAAEGDNAAENTVPEEITRSGQSHRTSQNRGRDDARSPTGTHGDAPAMVPEVPATVPASDVPAQPQRGDLRIGSIVVIEGRVTSLEIRQWYQRMKPAFIRCIETSQDPAPSRDYALVISETGAVTSIGTQWRLLDGCLRNVQGNARFSSGPARVRFRLSRHTS